MRQTAECRHRSTPLTYSLCTCTDRHGTPPRNVSSTIPRRPCPLLSSAQSRQPTTLSDRTSTPSTSSATELKVTRMTSGAMSVYFSEWRGLKTNASTRHSRQHRSLRVDTHHYLTNPLRDFIATAATECGGSRPVVKTTQLRPLCLAYLWSEKRSLTSASIPL